MTAFLLSLREGLEAALLVGILLGSLRRFGRQELGRFVWFGIGAALLVSVTVAGGLVAAGAQFEGQRRRDLRGGHAAPGRGLLDRDDLLDEGSG